ncbi:unnamed protein product [Closterium sp. Naga37s-1]|nr:unnamed protein product [Closterium sp. Naga37s-1]
MASFRAMTPSPPSKAQDAGGRGSAKRPSDASFANNKRQALSNRTNHVAPSAVCSPSQDQTRKKTRGSSHSRSAKKRHGSAAAAATAACTRVTRSTSQQASQAVARKQHTVVTISASHGDQVQLLQPSHQQHHHQQHHQHQHQHQQSERSHCSGGRLPDLRDLPAPIACPTSPARARAVAASGAAELAGASATSGGAIAGHPHPQDGPWLRVDAKSSCPGMPAVNDGGLLFPELHASGSAAAAFAFTQAQAQPQHRHPHNHAHAPARAPGEEHLHWRAHEQAYLAEAALLSTEASIGGSAERHQARYGEQAETAGGSANGFVSVPVFNGLSHGHGYSHFTAHVPLHSAVAATDRSTGFSDSAVPVTTAEAAAASTAMAAAEAALHHPVPFSAVPCAAIPASSNAAVPPTTTLTLLLPSSSSGGGSAGSVGGAGDVMGSAEQAQAQASAAAMDSINRKTERVLCISSVVSGRDGERQGDMEGALTEGPREGTSAEARLAETAHPSVSANSSQWAQVVEIRDADVQAEAPQVAGVGAPDAGAGVDAAKVRNIDSAHGDPQMCTKYAAEIYANMRDGERRHRPTMALEEGRGGDISAAMRGILMDWLVEVAEEYKLVPDTLFLTAAYIDRFLSHATVTRNHLQLLGIASMLIASKYEEIYAPQVDEFCYITDNTYRRHEVLLMERHVLAVLHFDLSTPTVKSFLRRFIKAAQATLPSPQHHLEFLGNYFAELTLVDYPCLRFLPSQIAAAAVFLAKLTLYPALPPWDATLQHYTGYAPSQLKEAVMALYDLQRNVKGCTLPAIREKYRQPKVLIHSSPQASPHSHPCTTFPPTIIPPPPLSLYRTLVSILPVDVWFTDLTACIFVSLSSFQSLLCLQFQGVALLPPPADIPDHLFLDS